jgi:hypothetical protein
MTELEKNIRGFALRALLAARGTMHDQALKNAVRSAFPNVAFTEGDLAGHIKDLEELKLVAGTDDPISGVMWDLTPQGKIKAQQLR